MVATPTRARRANRWRDAEALNRRARITGFKVEVFSLLTPRQRPTRCAECGADHDLEIDHRYERIWTAREVNQETRWKLYRAEAIFSTLPPEDERHIEAAAWYQDRFNLSADQWAELLDLARRGGLVRVLCATCNGRDGQRRALRNTAAKRARRRAPRARWTPDLLSKPAAPLAISDAEREALAAYLVG